ncbi:hypothetical protein [Flavobacterium stagni]|uniref:Uncharacterized protein n=1 Tax=Flavobacterium stagni TaxID=2506421 RepID=A0A4V1N2M8_9FLAO|nr:hypothetical protein [Flavobacterium stagni]RXR22544.1 hypothetical protein EQG61_08150 [Flavobacterium stagni]
MELQLIQGQFSPQEALSLLREMVDVKIKFHERKIATAASEEDIKFREKRIKDLQAEWQQIQTQLQQNERSISLKAPVNVTF